MPQLRKELFLPSIEGEARLLLLIDEFTTPKRSLEGRTKLAKLDFFLRYPVYFERALKIRAPEIEMLLHTNESKNIENRMIRYRYGPWDPAYYAILGRLIGKGLAKPVSIKKGIGYRTTEKGAELARRISKDENWALVAHRVKLLRRHLNLAGTTLKNFIYKHFPEVTNASWGEKI